MKEEYDFSSSKQNPYTHSLKKQVTIRIDEEAIDYFKKLSKEHGIPYQNLINLYLKDCAHNNKKLSISWKNENS